MTTSTVQRAAICSAILVALLGTSPAIAAIALAPGDPAPALTGVTFPLKRLFEADWSANRVTLVNFWASWCTPCRDEMPALDKLHRRMKGRGLQIVGVFETDDDRTAVGKFLEETYVTYTLVGAHKVVDLNWGGIAMMPTTFLVDQDGILRRKYVGALPEVTAGMIADVEALLDGRPMPPQVVPKPPPAEAPPAED
jgi:thiol-disulfide isomerase/thioredoxin